MQFEGIWGFALFFTLTVVSVFLMKLVLRSTGHGDLQLYF
jgi:hypothetical protein